MTKTQTRVLLPNHGLMPRSGDGNTVCAAPSHANERFTDSKRIKAWQCIGCGKIEAPQSCIGVCQDRRVEFVEAFEYDALFTRTKMLETLVRQLALTTPRTGEWERSYRALQEQARKAMAISGPQGRKSECAKPGAVETADKHK